MQLILTTDIPALGSAGDVVDVKPGYGANYLLPRGKAVLATANNQRQLKHQRRQIEAQLVRERAEAESLAARLQGLSVTLMRLVGEGDKIFGSVTNRDIAEALAAEGVEVDSRQIVLEAPLKALGVYEVDIKLHRDVKVQVKVWVVAD